MKLILSILNGRSRFEIDTSNGVYEVNVDTSFKILNIVKLCTPLNYYPITIISFENVGNHILFYVVFHVI
jgi:hypothetical protein